MERPLPSMPNQEGHQHLRVPFGHSSAPGLQATCAVHRPFTFEPHNHCPLPTSTGLPGGLSRSKEATLAAIHSLTAGTDFLSSKGDSD